MSSPPPPLADLLGGLSGAFAALGMRWFVFGAQAAIVHGVARLTADVDVTVDAGPHPTRALVDALSARGFSLRVRDVEAFAEATRVLPLVHDGTRIPVDVVLAGPGLEELFFARAEPRSVAGVTVPVACAEDLIVMKVLAGRPKDDEDVVTVVRAHTSLDVARVRATLDLIEQALDRRDLIASFEALRARAARG